MKKFIKKNWALIGWFLSIALDQQFEIVQKIVKDPDIVKLIYGIGSVVLARFWNVKNTSKRLLYEDHSYSEEDTVNPDKPQFPKDKL